jgi:Xaa-Pro dipeptidase
MLMTAQSTIPAAEFAARRVALAERARQLDLQAIVVTAKLHVEYLTGTWGSQFWLTPLIVLADGRDHLVVRRYDEDRVRAHGHASTLSSYFGQADSVQQWATAMRAHGVTHGRVGIECDGADLSPAELAALCAALPGLDIVDVTSEVPRLMAVKSETELTLMRASMHNTDQFIDAFAAAVGVGSSGDDLVAAMNDCARLIGAAEPRLAMLAAGSQLGVPHAAATGERMKPGDGAVVEVSGVVEGYSAALMRTALIGSNQAVEALHDVAAAALDAALSVIAPGVEARRVDEAARLVVERAGLGASFRHRTGYANGLRANGRSNISLEPNSMTQLEQGMTFHLPIHLFANGVSAGCSETVVVTGTGCSRLSRHPLALLRR